jgi:hypothetical protein
VTAEHRGPARCDGAHDAPLDTAQMPGTGLPKRFAVAAEDLRHQLPVAIAGDAMQDASVRRRDEYAVRWRGPSQIHLR